MLSFGRVDALAEIGTKQVLLPLLGWVALFAGATVAIGIVVFARCRKWLRDAGRPLSPATGILAVALFVALPAAAGWLGVGYSLRRTTISFIEAGGDGAQKWIEQHPIAAGWSFYAPYTRRGEEEVVALTTTRLREGARNRLYLLGGAVAGANLAALAMVGAISRRRNG